MHKQRTLRCSRIEAGLIKVKARLSKQN